MITGEGIGIGEGGGHVVAPRVEDDRGEGEQEEESHCGQCDEEEERP